MSEIRCETTLNHDFDKHFPRKSFNNYGICEFFHSISSRHGYRFMSFEELRVNDYLFLEFSKSPSPTWVVSDSSKQPSQVEKPRPKVRRTLGTVMPTNGIPVFVKVGKADLNSSVFILCRDLISDHSAYFRAALEEEWKVKETDETTLILTTIDLEDDDPSIFAIYVEWLNSGFIYSMASDTQKNDTEFKSLVRAYVLGDKLMDHGFKNTVIDAFIEKLNSDGKLDLELPLLIYELTARGSPLRRLLVDIYVSTAASSWFSGENLKHNSHPDFLLDFSRAQLDQRGEKGERPTYLNPDCAYHDHEDTHSSHICLERRMGTIFQARDRPIDLSAWEGLAQPNDALLEKL